VDVTDDNTERIGQQHCVRHLLAEGVDDICRPAFAALLLLLNVIFSSSLKDGVDQGLFLVSLLVLSVVPFGAAIYAWGFEQARWADSQFRPEGTTADDDEEDDA